MSQARLTIGSWAIVLAYACSESPTTEELGPVLTAGSTSVAGQPAPGGVPGTTPVVTGAGGPAMAAGSGGVAAPGARAMGQGGAPATAPTPNGDTDADGVADA